MSAAGTDPAATPDRSTHSNVEGLRHEDSTPDVDDVVANGDAARALRTMRLQALAAELGVVHVTQAIAEVIADLDGVA